MENTPTAEDYLVKSTDNASLKSTGGSYGGEKVMFKFDDDEPQELMEMIDKFTLELRKNFNDLNNQTASIEFKSANGKKFTLYVANK